VNEIYLGPNILLLFSVNDKG